MSSFEVHGCDAFVEFKWVDEHRQVQKRVCVCVGGGAGGGGGAS